MVDAISALFLGVALIFIGAFFAACSDSTAVPARSGDQLVFGTIYCANMDADDTPETIIIDDGSASLIIQDGDVVYHSRDKWRIVEASLGDTDHDGLLEVVALLDDDSGRHLGLFAFFGGEYRERLVTGPLTPRPLSLQVCATADQGDVILVTEQSAQSGNAGKPVIYRWNGFGFTIQNQPSESLP